MHHFAITIGPVIRTITEAKKTRELWAASFVFSFFMKKLLEEIQASDGLDIIAPNINTLASTKKTHGAGIWPDRCFFQIADAGHAAKFKADFKDKVENALKKVDSNLGSSSLGFLKAYIHCYAVCFDDGEDHVFDEGRLSTHLFRLNKMLDDLELMPKFIPKGKESLVQKLDKNIASLYQEGFDENDLVTTRTMTKRVRSLPEIALWEFSKTDSYAMHVVAPIERAQLQGGDNEDDAELEIFKNLKELFKKELKSRHRYVAIVHADGDGIGRTIESLGNNPEAIKGFSEELAGFAERAVEQIHRFGAVPVYAGGDDLLFVAPLQNHESKTIYELLNSLHNTFSEIPLFKEHGATLSFGCSLSYYKYPLGEAISASLHLLKDDAKGFSIEKGKTEKNALAVQLLTHSGHAFKTTIHQQGDSYGLWRQLFDYSKNLDEAFIAGLMHKTESLGPLFDACQRGTVEAFFDHHFNEAKGSVKWAFVEKVRDLASAIFKDYQLERRFEELVAEVDEKVKTVTDDKRKAAQDEGDEQKIKSQKEIGERLHALLRLVQFQNAPDHD